MKGIVFLDRDGVINHLVIRGGKLVSPRRISDFKLHDGVFEAIQDLKTAGFQVVVVTNQPDISRRKMSQSDLSEMNEKVLELGIDQLVICPHSDEDCCQCRKPKPGMLLQHLRSLPSPPRELWIVGDSERDVLAGRSVGAKTILIGSEKKVNKNIADFCSPDLRSAVKVIVV